MLCEVKAFLDVVLVPLAPTLMVLLSAEAAEQRVATLLQAKEGGGQLRRQLAEQNAVKLQCNTVVIYGKEDNCKTIGGHKMPTCLF